MYRIGEGYDVHKLVDNRDLILGGIKVPYEKGLLGHSDADVLVHAIMDSLLGTFSLGDIGKHFPDSDMRYKGISSIKLLAEVKRILESYAKTKYPDKSFKIGNIDATIICQAPKLRSFIDEMRKNIAETLNINIDDVNVKATTEEGLGFTGQGLGIAARSICIISID